MRGKHIDLTGQRFGKLVVAGPSFTGKTRRRVAPCLCDCGKITIVQIGTLMSGGTTSCGCSRILDLSGQRFGRLIAIERAYRNNNYSWFWRCVCDCGKDTIVNGTRLRNGSTQSCGCLRRERALRAIVKHGMYKDRIYNIHSGIVARCTNPRSKCFKDYGGRGITMCAEWRNDFTMFRDWALANGYQNNLSIDRIDNDGNYCPENCRWATEEMQHNNTRYNRLVSFYGETKTAAEWSRCLGIKYVTLIGRLNKPNWSIEQALTTPIKRELKK